MAAFERATVGLFLWWSASASLVGNPARAPTISRFAVAETAEILESTARARGLKVLERTDYSGLAALAGFRLRPTQSLLVDGAGSAPLKFVVWESDGGTTLVSVDKLPAHVSAIETEADLLRALAPTPPEIAAG